MPVLSVGGQLFAVMESRCNGPPAEGDTRMLTKRSLEALVSLSLRGRAWCRGCRMVELLQGRFGEEGGTDPAWRPSGVEVKFAEPDLALAKRTREHKARVNKSISLVRARATDWRSAEIVRLRKTSWE